MQQADYYTVRSHLDSTFSDDVNALLRERQQEAQRARRQLILQGIWGAVSALALILSIIAVSSGGGRKSQDGSASSSTATARLVSRIAFGSCTARDLRPQPIWTKGVIPANPDAWIWLGDFAYVDSPPWDGKELCAALPNSTYCNCPRDAIHTEPGHCKAADPDHVRQRFAQQLHLPEYRAFLDFMCPPTQQPEAAAAAATAGPADSPAVPQGSACARPILGVYDDHDFGCNNCNARMPRKHELKQFFLDAMGEPPSSPRRSPLVGIQQRRVLNAGRPGREVEVVLLDGRYYRDNLPCGARREWCEQVLKQRTHESYVWCVDFLQGGQWGQGACCRSDEELAGWCRQPGAQQHPLYRVACDPTSADFAASKVALSNNNSSLVTADDLAAWETPGSAQHLRLTKDSPICDVLGLQQRAWLRGILRESKAPLKLIATGSVPMGSLKFMDKAGACSGDDWLCYPAAQVNLLHTLANTSTGCVIVLTGDFHYSDIKVAQPGKREYSGMLQSEKLAKHLFQVMASGMSDTTALHNGAPCEGSFREDLVGLRPLGRCSFMARPSFGMLDIDWGRGTVKLQIRDGADGSIARGHDGSLQEVTVSLKSCQLVKH